MNTKLLMLAGWVMILAGCAGLFLNDRQEAELKQIDEGPNYYRGCVASAYQASRWDYSDTDEQLAECERLYGKKNI